MKELETSGSIEYPQVKFNEEKEILTMISIKAPIFEQNPDDKRAPIDLCCVIDISGSMAGAKLDLAKKALEFLVQNLDSQDRLSIVLYESNVQVLFDFLLMNAAGKSKSLEMIEGIGTKGSTNLCGGLLEGMSLMNQRKPGEASDISSILLFTDGLANQGIVDTNSITAEMEKKYDSNLNSNKFKRSTVFTFGFGSDHNQTMLRAIAEAGSGMYYFVEGVDYIPKSFADCLGGLQSVVAQNITLNLSTCEGQENLSILKSLNPKYKISQGGDFPTKSVTLELGDIYSEEHRDLIFLVRIPSLPQPEPELKSIFNFKLNYFNVLTSADDLNQGGLEISRPGEVDLELKPNLELDKQRNRLEAAEAMEKSRNRADLGDLEQARKRIDESKKKILDSNSAQDPFCQKLIKELDQCTQDLRNREHYLREGNKKMARKEQAHYYQRSNKVMDEEEDFYETSSKYKMKSSYH